MPLNALSRFVPITAWLSKSSPRTDIIAGITLAGLLVPQGMAYAGIAGVRPEMGLYAAPAGMFVYAVFGSSRQLAVTAIPLFAGTRRDADRERVVSISPRQLLAPVPHILRKGRAPRTRST
jgi:hypothetical protein